MDKTINYTISEIAEITEYPTHVLRYYEKEFELDIPRNSANHRYYTYKEVEMFNYIKSLQDKGFTNKQIKLILNSPEVLITDQQEEAAVTSITKTESVEMSQVTDIARFIEEVIANEIKPAIIERDNNNLQALCDLKEQIIELREEIKSKERDILICENAKLKMKVKEKSYEVAELKEKIKRKESNKNSFLKKILRIK